MRGSSKGRTVFPSSDLGDMANNEALSFCNSSFKSSKPPRECSPSDSPPLPNIEDPGRKFSPVKLASQFCKEFWQCRTAVTLFARASMAGINTCNVDETPSGSLWPVPVPRHWRWTAYERPNPRRRHRREFCRVRHQMVQIVICCLNFQACGFNPKPPQRAQLGAPISTAQHRVIERIEDLVSHFLGPMFEGRELGRAQEKFSGLISLVQELPRSEDPSFEDLAKLLMQVRGEFSPYSSHFVNPDEGDKSDSTHRCSLKPSVVSSQKIGGGSKPVLAARVKWENAPSFEAEEFLDPLTRAAFINPEVLRLPMHMWPDSRPAKVHCPKAELMRLVELWDSLGALHIMKAEDKDFSEAVGLFCVPKDEQFDRLIINPKTINSRMVSLSQSTKELAPGSMLSLLSLDPSSAYRFNADDLTDFYYTFRVSSKRAERNAIRCLFESHELSHLKTFDPNLGSGPFLVCLRSLAMGDSLAVEIAQQSHTRVLQTLCGSMLVHESLRYRHPVPRSSFIELLAIDDHVGIQKVTWEELKACTPKRDTEVFKNAEVAYKKVGLIQHERKRKRLCTNGTILGADFDGVKGRVMAPRSRISLLCLVTLAIARRGTCTRKVLSILTGCWIHILLFRRVLFSIMDDVFHQGDGCKMNEVFELSRKARNELQLLASLGPLAQSDLRAAYAQDIFCTDASPTTGAVISAHVGSEVTEELWRHCEQRGYYTRLQTPASEILSEKGIEPESLKMLAPAPTPMTSELTQVSVPAPMQEGILFDAVEVFRGSGNWSSTHASHGLTVHDGFDIEGSRLRYLDLAEASVLHELVALALRRVVREWHMGVPCISFGTLRRPQVRSKMYPAGFNPQDPFTRYHNMLARRACFVMTIALLSGQYVSAEQPENSRLFLLHCYRTLVLLGCVISHFTFCSFGTPFKKPSKWLHNKPWLIKLESKCTCNYRNKHFVIQGSFTKSSVQDFEGRCRPSSLAVFGESPRPGQAVAEFSAGYPYRLVSQMASGAVAAKRGEIASIPTAVRLRSLAEVGWPSEISSVPVSAEPAYPTRPGHEDPEWVTELCDSLPFKLLFNYRFKKPNHINVNEARTFKSWLKSTAKTHQDCRLVGILDSRVTIGAAAKGRSSSKAISRILQTTMPYTIGAGLYPGLLHIGSKENRADGPTRDRGIDPPTKELPGWLTALQRGDSRPFDCVVRAGDICKNPARWLRFLLLLLSNDVEPNPGPRRRGPFDFSVGFVEVTADRMKRCFEAFQVWVDERAGVPWPALLSDPHGLAWALRGYGLYCFETGLPRYMYVYAITGAQEFFPECRAHTAVAWQIDRKWQIHEPGQCRSVLPAVVIRAAVCIGTLWQWPSWVAITLLGFGAMLHPSEMVSLVRRDLVYPSDLNYDNHSLYVRIRDPKTARFARRQHGRIDDPMIIRFSEVVFGKLPLDSKIYPGSISTYRRQWNAVMDRLGVPFKQNQRGATPGVLRGSGATFLYASSEDVGWVAWRGRWARVRTLEHYLQEVGAQMLIHELSAISKSRIYFLADFAEAVLRSFCNNVLAEQEVRGGRRNGIGGKSAGNGC